jgi:hypothetical protein
MDEDALDDLVRRLTALVVKIDERDTHMAAMLANHDAILEELRVLTREQVRINQRLEILIQDIFHERHNGREA